MSGVAVATALATGIQHDYAEYLVHWAAILTGADSWAGRHAYGPLHNLFAAPFALWALLPKLTFVALALACGWLLLRSAGGREGPSAALVVAAAFLLNPLLFLSTYVYGQNDIVAAFFVLLALAARRSERPGLAGFFVGLASLEKFYPLALAAFLMLDDRPSVRPERDGDVQPPRVLRLRVPAVAVATFAVGMALAAAAWGSATVSPLGYATERGAKMLSILKFLACHPGLVGGEDVVRALTAGNGIAVLAVGLVALFLLARIGASWRAASAVGLLCVLATYKVGHPQFYVTWLVPFTWLLLEEDPRERRLGRRLVPVAAYLALFQVVYAATAGMTGAWEFLRCWGSVPFLVLVAGSLAAGLWESREPATRSLRVEW